MGYEIRDGLGRKRVDEILREVYDMEKYLKIKIKQGKSIGRV
jgi:hypothetical protein